MNGNDKTADAMTVDRDQAIQAARESLAKQLHPLPLNYHAIATRIVDAILSLPDPELARLRAVEEAAKGVERCSDLPSSARSSAMARLRTALSLATGSEQPHPETAPSKAGSS